MAYRVIKYFTDLQDNGYAYKVGDLFPHKGFKVSEDRLKELSSKNNRRHTPLIEKIEEKVSEVEEEKTEPVPEDTKPKKKRTKNAE